MFSIEIRDKETNHLVKRKYYKTKEQYERWFERHTKKYGRVYNVIGNKIQL